MSPKSQVKYQPQKRTSIEVLKLKIQKISVELETHKKLMIAVTQSYNKHMDYLSNFARHDMGNAIQNISATLQSMEGKVDVDVIKALNSSISNLNSTLDNLGKLIPYSPNRTFKLYELINAVEILVRQSSRVNQAKLMISVDRNERTEIIQPFQALLQLLHNLVINSQKAMKEVSGEKLIKIDAKIVNETCVIKIMDTGCGIPSDNLNKIFEYGFTTTSGSGIGLFHAKYLCTEIGGDIKVSTNVNGFSTVFTLTFPTDGSKKNSCD